MSKKYKMKTKKAFAKRVLETGTGKLKRKQAFRSHLAPNKTTKQKRQSRAYAILNKPQMKRASQLLQK